MPKILIVEDDPVLASLIKARLEFRQYVVELANSGEDALALLNNYRFDTVVLNWETPQLDGLSVLQQFRALGGATPVLLLSGKHKSLFDKKRGFEAGADDYLTKPCAVEEISMRIEALLRRSSSQRLPKLRCQHVVLDSTLRQITADGKELQLTRTEYSLLELLLRYQNYTFSYDALLNRVWRSDSRATRTSVRTYISRLRQLLAVQGKPSVLVTVHGVGYKLRAD
jgi:two-component system response regulator MprA